ncbi:MAG: hypothetical protein N4A40_12905 [Tissierellales bacterium]|nr:hypothetical protein [Tissierellales bacterium]
MSFFDTSISISDAEILENYRKFFDEYSVLLDKDNTTENETEIWSQNFEQGLKVGRNKHSDILSGSFKSQFLRIVIVGLFVILGQYIHVTAPIIIMIISIIYYVYYIKKNIFRNKTTYSENVLRSLALQRIKAIRSNRKTERRNLDE